MSFARALAALSLALALLGAPGSFAADKTVNVKFPKGSNGTTIEGSIRGRDGIVYKLDVSAGQKLSVQLDTDNDSNYFNIVAPGATEAAFNGSIDGNSTTFVIPSSGKYEIDVYLMRNAARRNERANFTLTLYVEGKVGKPVAPVSDAIDTSLMPRFCAGEASAKFSVRPQDITTNMAFKSGKLYVSQGNYTQGGKTTFFNCWFSAGGQFQYIN
jgi:hypothetical protein